MAQQSVPQKKSAAKQRTVPIVIGIAVGLAIVGIVGAIAYLSTGSTYCPCEPAPKSFSLASAGTGNLGTTVAYPWALASCVAASPCHTYNFTVLASSGLATDQFGLKILEASKTTVPGWKAVLWSASGIAYLATFSAGDLTWTCSAYSNSTYCPVGDLSNTGLMIITPTSLSLGGTGDSIVAYGIGSNSVGGSTTF
jgi:hypothetical protein